MHFSFNRWLKTNGGSRSWKTSRPQQTFALSAVPRAHITCIAAAPVMLYGHYYGGVPAALTAAVEPSMKNSLPCFLSLCAAMLFTAALLRAFKERADATPARRMLLTIPTLRCARAATRRASRSHNDITYAAEPSWGWFLSKHVMKCSPPQNRTLLP